MQVSRMLDQIKNMQHRVTELGMRGKRVALWAVTDLLRRALEDFELPESAIVVDSDPRRRTHLENKGITVFQPKERLDHLKASELVVICAPRYKTDILHWIARETGRSLGATELMILGTGSSGESLL